MELILKGSWRVCTLICGITRPKPWHFCSKNTLERRYTYYLKVQTVFGQAGGCLCSLNFERDIVDTLCHASRKSATIRPNKAGFLLQEGRVQRVGIQFQLSRTLVDFWPSLCVESWVVAPQKGWKSERTNFVSLINTISPFINEVWYKRLKSGLGWWIASILKQVVISALCHRRPWRESELTNRFICCSQYSRSLS